LEAILTPFNLLSQNLRREKANNIEEFHSKQLNRRYKLGNSHLRSWNGNRSTVTFGSVMQLKMLLHVERDRESMYTESVNTMSKDDVVL
jgi:hypothetical protein